MQPQFDEPRSAIAPAISAASEEAALIDWLRERDTPCPLCGYNLRALSSPRCPECGNEVRLSVSLVDPYVRAWITLAVAVCGSAGLGFLLLCMVARAGLPSGSAPIAAVLFFIATTPTPFILLASRRRFQRFSRKRQWLVASLVAIWPLGAMALLCANLR